MITKGELEEPFFKKKIKKQRRFGRTDEINVLI